MKHNIARSTLVAIVGATSSLHVAARVLGYAHAGCLGRRLRSEGLSVVRRAVAGQTVTIVEDALP